MKAAPYRPPRGCMWPSFILGSLCLLLGGLSLLAIPKMWQRSQEEWTETPGVIVEPYVETGERYHRDTFKHKRRSVSTKTTYHVRLKYHYSIEGKEYAGDAPALRQPENDENNQQARAILPTYPTGDRVAVFYHPTDVSQSRLTLKEPPQEFGFDVCFAFAFLVCGIGLVTIGRWISKSTRRVE